MPLAQIAHCLAQASIKALFVILVASIQMRVCAAGFDLYFQPSGGGVSRLDLDSPAKTEQVISDELINVSNGLAIDPIGRKLYWIADTEFTNVDKIRRSDLDGSNVELVHLPTGQPTDLKIDPFASKLYFSEAFTDAIQVINLDGTGLHSLVHAAGVVAVDLDFVNDAVYWADVESNRLRRCNFDGSGAVDVIATGMMRPIDVDVDPVRVRLYWAELGPDIVGEPVKANSKIWTAQLDGSNPKLIAEDLYQPVDVVVDAARGSIYWSEGIEGVLWRADLDGGNASIMTEIPFGLYHNLALDAPPIVPEPASVHFVLLFGACALRRRLLGP